MKTTEIVFGDASYLVINKTKFKNNNIIKLDMLFNIANLKDIDKFKYELPKGIYNEPTSYDFTKEMNLINKAIQDNQILRLWLCKNEIHYYLILLYLCFYLKNKNVTLMLCLSDEFNATPGGILPDDYESITPKMLPQEQMNTYADMWEEIAKENSEMRILENDKIICSTFNYYDNLIKETLKSANNLHKAIAQIMQKTNLDEALVKYLIKRYLKEI